MFVLFIKFASNYESLKNTITGGKHAIIVCKIFLIFSPTRKRDNRLQTRNNRLQTRDNRLKIRDNRLQTRDNSVQDNNNFFFIQEKRDNRLQTRDNCWQTRDNCVQNALFLQNGFYDNKQLLLSNCSNIC